MTTPETTQRRDVGPGAPAWRLVATGPTALPDWRVMISATIAITVGGISRVILTFRARASRPAAQESPRGPDGACGIVSSIPDHVNFIPAPGAYLQGSFSMKPPY